MDDERLTGARLIAALDQVKATLADVAGILGDYRRQLMLAGFPPDDALELCLELQRASISVDRG